jgi:hypothetical protein
MLVHVQFDRRELEFGEPLHRGGKWHVGQAFRTDADEHVRGAPIEIFRRTKKKAGGPQSATNPPR